MHRNEKMHQGVGEIINRKMMMSRRFWKHWKIAEASSSSNNNGEAEIIMRGGLNINERRTTRRRRSMRVKNMSSGGFVSWNADYHVPRLHPPKNN
ncbi:root meristem growth factor 2-like [Senna tora]|uniref:Root meristem growth factor 2-like n=1 Tax=Senna tora TaxID=362788 RepID=A0A834X4N9_9FABA|nr:root meristem growth factor 2-like [Senna tora]